MNEKETPLQTCCLLASSIWLMACETFLSRRVRVALLPSILFIYPCQASAQPPRLALSSPEASESAKTDCNKNFSSQLVLLLKVINHSMDVFQHCSSQCKTASNACGSFFTMLMGGFVLGLTFLTWYAVVPASYGPWMMNGGLVGMICGLAVSLVMTLLVSRRYPPFDSSFRVNHDLLSGWNDCLVLYPNCCDRPWESASSVASLLLR